MNATPPRPDPEPSRARHWAEDFGVFANDATQRLGAFGRRLRVFNAHAAQWITTVSWRRLGLLGFVVLIGTAIVGDITGFGNNAVQIDADALRKPVDIAIHSDGKNVHIQPSIGGKQTRPIDVPIPEMPTAPPAPGAPPAAGAPALPSMPPSAGAARRGIVFEKDGKRIVIDKDGVRVLEGDAARRDAEAAGAAARQDRRGGDADRSGDADPDESRGEAADLDAEKATHDAARALASAKLSQIAADQVRRNIADDMSLQVKAAVEDAKDEVQSAISDEIRAAARRTPPSFGGVLYGFVKFVIGLAFIYLIVLKITSNTRRRAAVAVQSASEVAERESLKRQVSEAKMQMMQAQVEPHFLFNTLASIDHLIETDPPRASTMQKNLIQYLRAALPQMRENATDLGREVDLVSAYLEILKVRMEERLQVSFDVPNGLRSADFPPMMLQSMVENAIKHGLEPKAEGGQLEVLAEIAHGDLRVTVADTGLGFAAGGASTSGTGLGLTNIRERLKLLYGDRATLTIEANQVDGAPLGTRVTISVPYQTRRSGAAPRSDNVEENVMRKTILLLSFVMFALLLVVVAIAVGVVSADAMNGATVTIDGESFSGTVLAGTVGCGVAIGLVLIGLLVLGVLASVAIVVPFVLALTAVVVVLSLVIGLAPVLVPALLLVGGYVLLSRWTKRRAARDASAPTVSPHPPSPTIS